MRFFHPLNKIINSEPKVRILRFLAETGTEISGLQLAKLLKLSPTTVHKAMQELMAEKVVRMRAMGRAHSFRLDQDNLVVAKILCPMFQSEKGILPDLKEELGRTIRKSSLKNEILSVVLFGSIHEKSEGPGSDIDLFVVVKSAASVQLVEGMFSEIGAALIGRIGMVVSPFVISLDAFRKKNKAGASVVKAVVNSHDVIFGKSLGRLL
ncbi:MAG: winged helix-turn-helix transcriptional regulator [Candidatus Omnitrophica bacterium]|nr:winged helix-turn-helix transcriptional regulator [Candidatus Omnitrophota bacterium]